MSCLKKVAEERSEDKGLRGQRMLKIRELGKKEVTLSKQGGWTR